jgi:two-component system LytT family response regulator
MSKLRVLIVDDEPLIRTGIRNGLSVLDGVEIAGECESGSAAIEAILSRRPDLVLLDVQMQDCTGLDVVQQVGPERMPPVIFVTAYDEYAVKAFELNAVDYLLKPFDDERLRHGIERARERIAGLKQTSLSEQLQALLDSRHQDSRRQRWTERIVVRNGERFDFVPVESIDWVESANNYVQLHCGAKEYLLGETLTNLENRLNPDKFIRIHRRRIVNISRVGTVHSMLGGTYEMELRGGTRLTTGREYKEAVQALIKNHAGSPSTLEIKSSYHK